MNRKALQNTTKRTLSDFMPSAWFDFDTLTFHPENMKELTRKAYENHLVKMNRIDELVTIVNDSTTSKKALSAAYTELVTMLHFTHHHDTEGRSSKLHGLASISTSALYNKFCLAKKLQAMLHPEKNIICKYCYAITQQRQQIGVMLCGIRNRKILSSVVIPVRYFMFADVGTEQNLRIETFGDVDNVNQVRNYIHLVKAWSAKHFAAWSKNTLLWFKGFELEGKPKNLSFVVSSLIINAIMPIPEKYMQYVDHRFTVFTAKYAKDHNIAINCSGRKCITCLLCYRKNNVFDIFELKK